MRALIFCGGDVKDLTFTKNIIKDNDLLIAADSGYEHLKKFGIEPDIFIGDMDSVKSDVTSENIIKLNVMKDETDTEAAINLAISKGVDDIVILGGIGSRADHSVANMLLLKSIKDADCSGCVVNENNEIYYMENYISIKGSIGQTVSVIPMCDLENVHTQGLVYKLEGETLFFGKSRGVSNVMTSEICTIKADRGCALVFKSKD